MISKEANTVDIFVVTIYFEELFVQPPRSAAAPSFPIISPPWIAVLERGCSRVPFSQQRFFPKEQVVFPDTKSVSRLLQRILKKGAAQEQDGGSIAEFLFVEPSLSSFEFDL